MENQEIFILCLIVGVVLLYIPSICENYVSGSFDITSAITTDMDWKGSQLSKIPTYPNNLVQPSGDLSIVIKDLQTYNPSQFNEVSADGPTSSTYVNSGMILESDINNPNNLEGFSMMNPYIEA